MSMPSGLKWCGASMWVPKWLGRWIIAELNGLPSLPITESGSKVTTGSPG